MSLTQDIVPLPVWYRDVLFIDAQRLTSAQRARGPRRSKVVHFTKGPPGLWGGP